MCGGEILLLAPGWTSHSCLVDGGEILLIPARMDTSLRLAHVGGETESREPTYGSLQKGKEGKTAQEDEQRSEQQVS